MGKLAKAPINQYLASEDMPMHIFATREGPTKNREDNKWQRKMSLALLWQSSYMNVKIPTASLGKENINLYFCVLILEITWSRLAHRTRTEPFFENSKVSNISWLLIRPSQIAPLIIYVSVLFNLTHPHTHKLTLKVSLHWHAYPHTTHCQTHIFIDRLSLTHTNTLYTDMKEVKKAHLLNVP